MAFGLFLNFEKLSLQIIENEIAQMTNDNILHYEAEDDEIDEKQFENNLYHGSIAVTFVVNLYETALNTILSRHLSCSEIEVFKTSHDVKLQLICAMCGTDISIIKSNNSYGVLKNTIKLRNDIVHYKSNEIGMGSYLSAGSSLPMGTNKKPISMLFTKDYMENGYKSMMKVLDLICEKCGLAIYKDCQVIDCDGRDLLCEFIVKREDYQSGEQTDVD